MYLFFERLLLLVSHFPNNIDLFLMQSTQILFLLLTSLLVYYIVQLLHFVELFFYIFVFLFQNDK